MSRIHSLIQNLRTRLQHYAICHQWMYGSAVLGAVESRKTADLTLFEEAGQSGGRHFFGKRVGRLREQLGCTVVSSQFQKMCFFEKQNTQQLVYPSREVRELWHCSKRLWIFAPLWQMLQTENQSFLPLVMRELCQVLQKTRHVLSNGFTILVLSGHTRTLDVYTLSCVWNIYQHSRACVHVGLSKLTRWSPWHWALCNHALTSEIYEGESCPKPP